MAIVADLQIALAGCKWDIASQHCCSIVDLGRQIIAQHIDNNREFDPIPILEHLVDALDSTKIQWQDETKYHIARATRLFSELACMKCVLDQRKIRPETQKRMRQVFDVVMDYSRNHVALVYELKCCSEALKFMEEPPVREFLIAIFKAAVDPSIKNAIHLMDLLPRIIAMKSNDWFSEALFLSWMGRSARHDRKLFLSLRDTLSTESNVLEMAQTGVEFFADILWNGSPELQMEALSGQISILTLMNLQSPKLSIANFMKTMWPVRFRATQIIATLLDHPNPTFVKIATYALYHRRIQESHPKVKELLTTIEKKPYARETWKTQFQENQAQALEQNVQERDELERQEAKVRQLEMDLAIARSTHRLSETEIKTQQLEVEQQKQYVAELREECDAHRENVEALHNQYNKFLNEIIDNFSSPASPPPQKAPEGPPPHLCCPLSLDLMTDPVLAEDGNTYEREQIETWFKTSSISPLTREVLKSKKLITNRTVRDAIEAYKQQTVQSLPSPSPSPIISRSARSSIDPQTSSSPRLSLSAPPSDTLIESYKDLILNLLENSSVQSNTTLVIMLRSQLKSLMGRENVQLTQTENEAYKWTCKLLVNQKVSQVVLETLLELYGDSTPPVAAQRNSSTLTIPKEPKFTISPKSSFQPAQNRSLLAQEQFNLALDYIFARNGNIQNLDRAIDLLRRGAELNHSESQYYMGWLCDPDRGTDLKLRQLLEAEAKKGDLRRKVRWILFDHVGSYAMRNASASANWYRQAAEQGFPEAQFSLGWCYATGQGVQKDMGEAIRWYEQSANQGNVAAQLQLGNLFNNGQGVPKDKAMAAHWYEKAAEQGNGGAQLILGGFYLKGQGVILNAVEAAKWYREAAEQGIAEAQYNLGVCYSGGQGVQQDFVEAVRWYRKAAEEGYSYAQFNLAECYDNGQGFPQNATEAARWYRKAAEQGRARAQFQMGLLLASGRGVAKDEVAAVQWYVKAAEQGLMHAQLNLGICYANGQGVEKNDAQAVYWYTKAAEQGDSDAQTRLAACYAQGKGVAKRDLEAFKWYKKAAEQGHSHAQYYLGECYEKGTGTPQILTDAVKWYRKAAEQGRARAQHRLAWCLSQGLGVAKDDNEANYWFRKAAEQGLTLSDRR